MRLADLAASNDSSLSELANAVGVRALLLQRIDAGRQGMPRSLAHLIAERLLVDVVDVLAACPLTTTLEGPVLLHPIPPIAGEDTPPARIVPTAPIVVPTPSSEVLYALEYRLAGDADGSSVLQRFAIGPNGSLTLTAETDQDDPGFTGDLYSLLHGAIGVDGNVWIRGNTVTEPITARLNSETLAIASQGPLTGPVTAYAKVAVDPVSGWLWLTTYDGNLYSFDPSDLGAGAATLDLTVDESTQLCGALCFPGDGFLYATTYDADLGTQTLQKIDPTPGASAVVQVGDAFLSSFNEGLQSLEWAPIAGKLYSGYVNSLLEWDMTTLNPVVVGSGPVKLFLGGAYDATTDSIWFTCRDESEEDEPSYLLVRVVRSTGVADFLSDRFNAPVSQFFSPVLTHRRVVFVPTIEPGNDSPDLNSVRAYTMDGDPVLLTTTLVGSGPSDTGQNNPAASLVYLRR